VIAANRALLAALVATNFLGQNTPAIAATEALYMEFWAQDAGAMYSYASSSAAATQLTELPQPAEVSDPTGVVDQAIAAVKGAGQAVQAQLNAVGSQLVPRVGDVIQTLSGPINGQGPAIDAWIAANTPLDDLVPLYTKYISPYLNLVALTNQTTLWFGDDSAGFAKIGTVSGAISKDVAEAAAKAAQAAASAGRSLGGVAANLGNALPIGKLSAPASWSMANVPSPAGATAISNATAIPAAAQGAAGNVPMTGPFGQFVNGGNGRKTPAYGHRLTFMTRPPAAG
jgi:PPE-repeat protein